MNINELENILIFYDKPVNASEGYLYLKNPIQAPSGGLQQQIAITKDSVTLGSIVKDIFYIIGFNSYISNPLYLMIVVSIISLVFSFKIHEYPDEFVTLLKLIKETDRGFALDENKLNDLISENPQLTDFLDLLEDEKLIKKRSNGKYFVLKKVVAHLNFKLQHKCE